MILTVTKVKQMPSLNISLADSSRDTAIKSTIKQVQDFIINYCKNYFENENVYIAGLYQFVASGKKIICPGETFSDIGLAKGSDFLVEGSCNNDGIYEANEISVGSLIVNINDDEPLIDENLGYYVTITRVIFPPSVRRTASKMIAFDFNKAIAQGMTSETIADYSANFGDDYPKSILRELVPFRRLEWKYAINRSEKWYGQ